MILQEPQQRWHIVNQCTVKRFAGKSWVKPMVPQHVQKSLKGMLINVPRKQHYNKILQGLEILWMKTTGFKAQNSPPDPLTSRQVPYRCKSPLNLPLEFARLAKLRAHRQPMATYSFDSQS